MAVNTHRDTENLQTGYQDAGSRRLYRLEELDEFEVADWDPDIRGWNLVDDAGRLLGTINALIVELEARKVRYLDVTLDPGFAGTDTARHTLVPIGLAVLDEDNHHVVLGAAARAALLEAPAYTGGPFDWDYERALRRAYTAGGAPVTGTTAGFYEHDLYDVNRFAGRRRI